MENTIVKDAGTSTIELTRLVIEMAQGIEKRLNKENKTMYADFDEHTWAQMMGSCATVCLNIARTIDTNVPDELLSKSEKYKVLKTIETADDLLKQCAHICNKYEDEDDDDEEDDDDGIKGLLKDLQNADPEMVKDVLKKSGLDAREIEWCKGLIETGRDLDDDDMEVAISILKKLH